MHTIRTVNKYKEPNHIYCGRGSPLGNPFVMKSEADRDKVCDQYEKWFYKQIQEQTPEVMRMLDHIRHTARSSNINLGCFCSPKRCHCDTIKDYLDGISA